MMCIGGTLGSCPPTKLVGVCLCVAIVAIIFLVVDVCSDDTRPRDARVLEWQLIRRWSLFLNALHIMTCV